MSQTLKERLSKYRFKKFHKLRFLIYPTIWITLLALCNQRVTQSVALIGFVKITKGKDGTSGVSSTTTSAPNFSSVANPSNQDDDKCEDRYTSKNEYIIKNTTKYEWSESQQEISNLLYNFGYMIGHVPGTFLTLKIGIHPVMVFIIFSCSLITLASIYAAESYFAYQTLRILLGFISGSMYPIVNQSVAVHSPPHEQHKVHMFIHTANFISSAIVFPLGGYLIEYHVNGWKGIFMFTSLFGFFAAILWTVLAWSEPDENPFMSKVEQDHIRNAIYPNGKPKRVGFNDFPFKAMFMDKQVYLNSACHFGKLMLLYMNLLGVVKYLRTFFRLSPLMAGVYGIIPFLAEATLQLSYSSIITLIVGNRLSRSRLRKLNTLIGAIGANVFLFASGFIWCDQLAGGIILQSLSLMFVAPYQGGYFLGIIERYGRFSGITFSFINIAGSLSGICQRGLVVALQGITQNTRKAYQWSFIITSILSFLCSIPFILFGNVDKPDWVLGNQAQTTNYTVNVQEKDEGSEDSDEVA